MVVLLVNGWKDPFNVKNTRANGMPTKPKKQETVRTYPLNGQSGFTRCSLMPCVTYSVDTPSSSRINRCVSPDMNILGHIRKALPVYQMLLPIALLPYVLLPGSSRFSAQPICGVAQTEPIRVVNATGVSALRAALACTAGGSDVQADWAGRVSVGAPIVISEGVFLSVTGEDSLAEVHAASSQANRTRLFEVAQGGGLTLTQLKLSGGSADGGGAVYSRSATPTLDNCVFDSNLATNGSGGAVWADGGNVTIVGGEFMDNRATRYGGAVHAVDGKLLVTGGSHFEGNKAGAGGALFCGAEETGPSKLAAVCSIAEAEFASNSATRKYQVSTSSEFAYQKGGGAAVFLSAIVDITESTFSGNQAMGSGVALNGGPLTNITINGCILGNNTSNEYGGAISASSSTLGGRTQLTHNSASNGGGAVSVGTSVMLVHMTLCVLSCKKTVLSTRNDINKYTQSPC